MKNKLVLLCIFLLLLGSGAHATTFTEDFSGDLSNWTAGPSHLDNYSIIGGELFMDGWGHNTAGGGWGVLQFNQTLGSSFTATWDAKVTEYDYANFVLFADSPWGFNTSLGYADNGYLSWIDIDDPSNPVIDIAKRSTVSAGTLPPTNQANVSPDISLNEWFNWRIEKEPNTIKVFINNVLLLDTFDDEFANSNFKLGLSFGEDSEGYIDNLIITTENPVPEPATMLLFGFGLLGLAGVSRRKK